MEWIGASKLSFEEPELSAFLDATSERSWPSGWQDEFGRYDFFYLAGLPEFFEKVGVASKTRIQSDILEAFEEVSKRPFRRNWLKIYPGGNLNDMDASHPSVGLSALGARAVRKIVLGEPASFPKAMQALRATMFLGSHRFDQLDFYGQFQIRFANAYIPFASEMLLKITTSERMALINELGGVGAQSALDELAVGFPVTREFADTVVKHLRLSSGVTSDEGTMLRVERYSSRYEITAAVKYNLIDARSTKRVAKGEPVRI